MEMVRDALARRTTLGVGGEAEIAACDSIDDIRTALAHAHEGGSPFWVLGEGSNTLASDAGYAGVVIHPRMSAVSLERDGDRATMIADAGAHWDGLVDRACAEGLWGIENLAGIPGSAGAAPVQNIGAYGAELSDMLLWVECVDARDGSLRRFDRAACGFGYRASRFKNEPELIITRIALALSRAGEPNLGYKDLAAAGEAARRNGAPLDTPAAVAEAVRSIRAAKFPDLSKEGTAGSFFKNPSVSAAEFERLRARYPELPGFPQGADSAGGVGAEPAKGDFVKIPLAFVLDKILGLRGYRLGAARLYEKQPLVLVADRGASARDVDALADDVARKVFGATRVAIEREVRSMK
jgi:UDP-N-acetylmuramate dehydrogenase